MDIMKELFEKIPKRIRICFLSSLILGFITHFIMLTHKLPNWDDLGNYNYFGVGGEFGRWFLRFLHPIGGTWSNQWLNGGLAILILAFAMCFLYEGFGLTSTTSAVLLPMIFMTFPSLACTMTFMFMVDLSATSILLSCIAFYLVRRYSYGFLLAIIPLVFSMGLYQSYICFTISAMLTALLIDSLKKENTFAVLMKRGFSYAVTLLASVAIYYIVAILRYPQLTSTQHNGIGSMGHISLIRLPKLIVKAYLRIANYFLIGGYSYQSTFMHICNILIVITLIFMFVLVIRRKNIQKQKGNFIFALICVILFPLGMSFVDIMAPDANFSALMIYQYAFLYAAILILYEQLANNSLLPKLERFACLWGVILILLTSYGDYLITNEAYFRTEMAYERVYAYLNRMLARVESMDGYQDGDPIMLAGTFNQEQMHGYLLDEEKFYDFSGLAMEYGLLTPGARENFMGIYFGVGIEFPDEDIVAEIKETPEYQEMSAYPSDNCVKKIGSRWIVKIG